MADFKNLWALWSSGFVRRWHMNPALSWLDDYTCAHQGRCGLLVIALFPDHSINLLRAAITHDAAEVHVGDLGAPFKASGRNLVAHHAAFEEVCLRDMGLGFSLTPEEQDRLKLVDRLDAYLFVLLRGGAHAFCDGWPCTEVEIIDRAHALGVGGAVIPMIREAQVRGGK